MHDMHFHTHSNQYVSSYASVFDIHTPLLNHTFHLEYMLRLLFYTYDLYLHCVYLHYVYDVYLHYVYHVYLH